MSSLRHLRKMYKTPFNTKAHVIKATAPFDLTGKKSVFLAGSIEMGAAPNWQEVVEDALSLHDITILNPRRDDWDSSWTQSIDDPQFYEQVEWELRGQEEADVIAFYFAPSTKAPITLLELGLAARSGKAAVCCPEGYWRKGNVEMVCDRYRIPLVGTVTELVEEIINRIG